MRVAGFTSTGSKRPEPLFGEGPLPPGIPTRMARSGGCRLWDGESREYLDMIMGLGAVALGYGHPAVTAAVIEATHRGAVGSLAPALEEELAGDLAGLLPVMEQVRFFKTGAEAVAAAVRLARAATGRERVLGCGYHGWLDWCSREPGVPAAVQALYQELPFNDVEGSVGLIRQSRGDLAAVVIEPVIDAVPNPQWLAAIRRESRTAGTPLVFDEIKTWPRTGLGGAAARWGGEPDLIVLGKALANGFPLAAVGGRRELMQQVERTWISSTLATEFVSLAAGRAVLQVVRETNLPGYLAGRGERLHRGLAHIAQQFPEFIAGVRGIPEMCYLQFPDPTVSAHVARECVRRGVLFKRSAYNFVSLAHQDADVDLCLDTVEAVLDALRRKTGGRVSQPTARPPDRLNA
ncbi:MAG: aminotransferase class III-fold pyridoxal phosphate-dependent enzyme [Gemmatimonadales bacterium]